MENAERDAITKEWLARITQSFPSRTQHFLAMDTDRFRNPMGHTIRENLPVVLEELLGTMDSTRLSAALEAIVRIGAVQECTPRYAVEFIFQLQPVLQSRRNQPPADWDEIAQRIQEAALMAFDLYMTCREKIYALRADEARRRTAQLERLYLETDGELR